MVARSFPERLLQAAGYEIGGLLLAAPACAMMTGTGAEASSLLVIQLSLATLIWAPLFNMVFDRLEWRMCRRVASDRPNRLRLIHAFALEISDMVISVPLLIWLGGLSVPQAVLADLGLTIVWIVYGYAYHLGFDRARPVRRPA